MLMDPVYNINVPLQCRWVCLYDGSVFMLRWSSVLLCICKDCCCDNNLACLSLSVSICLLTLSRSLLLRSLSSLSD